ncbi:YfiR family protein [Azonexus sp.]|uniref:YfiR family protein n=1 Tax=Azonexus sp. TaxID=1872668 RepID=UPI0028369560|nr:YfiR family protein [Azonexus sp.]MDR1996434.1 YfiR family protein [Azonexus sp.]
MHRLFARPALILFGIVVAGVLYIEPAGVLHIRPASAASVDVGTQVGRVVAGILSYARWPTPVETYRFCTVGEVVYLHAGWKSLGQATSDPVTLHRLTGDESSWVADCDVLYIGGVTPALRSRLLAEAVGKPALTISEGDSVCAEPSMFCLAVQGSEVGLLANLDAISRSGIRIDPKVLQLVRRRQGGK